MSEPYARLPTDCVARVTRLASEVSQCRPSLEQALYAEAKEFEKPEQPLHKAFVAVWVPEIVRSAITGLRGCCITVEFPKTDFPNLYRTAERNRKTAFLKLISELLEGSGMNTAFGDWRIKRGSEEPLSVMVYLSWPKLDRT